MFNDRMSVAHERHPPGECPCIVLRIVDLYIRDGRLRLVVCETEDTAKQVDLSIEGDRRMV